MFVVLLALEDKPEVWFEAGRFVFLETAKFYRKDWIKHGYCDIKVVGTRIKEVIA